MFQHRVAHTANYSSHTPCFNTGFLTQLATEAQAPLGLPLPRHGVVATCVRNPGLKTRVCRESFPGVLCQGSIGNNAVLLMLEFQATYARFDNSRRDVRLSRRESFPAQHSVVSPLHSSIRGGRLSRGVPDDELTCKADCAPMAVPCRDIGWMDHVDIAFGSHWRRGRVCAVGHTLPL